MVAPGDRDHVPTRRRARRVWLAALLVWTLPAAAQYTPPGTASPTEGTPDEETLEQVILESPWSVGPVKISPWLGLSDAQLVSNDGGFSTDEEGEDFTATAGAGLRAYLRAGSKVVLAAHALPEYVWWQDNERKRRLNGRYGAGLFGYFNRLTVEVSGRLAERQGFFSNEVQELTTNRRETLRAALALRLGNRLELFADAQRQDVENLEDEDVFFGRLDREDHTTTVGVRYRAPSGLTFELAAENRELEFGRDARNLSSSGTSRSLAVAYGGARLELRLALADETLDPEPGSEFRGFDDLTGTFDVLWTPPGRLTALAYARRGLNFSLDPGTSHFVGERLGGRLDLELGPATLSVVGENGGDDYKPLTAAGLERRDDVSAVGAELSFRLRKLLTLSVRAGRTEYDSNIDVFDRDVSTVGVALELGDVLKRLSLGSAGGTW